VCILFTGDALNFERSEEDKKQAKQKEPATENKEVKLIELNKHRSI